MATERELILRLRFENQTSGEFDKIRQGLQDIQNQTEAVGAKGQSAFQRFNEAAGEFAINLLATAGRGIVDFAREGVIGLAEFETQLSGVRRTTGMSTEDMNRLGESFRQFSVTDLQGIAKAEDLARIAEVAGQLGITGAQNIQDFSKSIAEIAFATDINADKAATDLGRLTSIFQSELERPRVYIDSFGNSITTSFGGAYQQVDNLGSVLNDLAAESNATTTDLLNMSNRMAGSGKLLGLMPDQLMVVASILKDNVPIAAERASTAMNSIMSKMLTHSSGFAAAFKLDAAVFADAVKKDPLRALELLAGGMQKLKDTQGPDVLKRTIEALIGKGDAVNQVMLGLAGTQDKIRERTLMASESFRQNVSVQNEIKIAAESQQTSWNGVLSQWSELQKRGAEVLKPATDAALNFAHEVLGEMITNGEKFVNFFGEGFGLPNLGTALKGLAEAPDEILTHWESFQAGMTEQIGVVKAAILNFDIGGWWQKSMDTLATNMGWKVGLQAMVDGFYATKDKVQAVFTEMPGKINEALSSLADKIIAPFETAYTRIKEIGTEIEGTFKSVANAITVVSSSVAVPALNANLAVMKARLGEIKTENFGLIQTSQELGTTYRTVLDGMNAAIAANVPPSQKLIEQFQNLQAQIKAVGVESHGQSTFPEMVAAQEAARSKTVQLSQEMAAMKTQIGAVGAQYDAVKQQIYANEKAINAVNEQIVREKVLANETYGLERQAHDANVAALGRKKQSLDAEVKSLREIKETDAFKQQERDLKALEVEQQKATSEVDQYQQSIAEMNSKLQESTAEHSDLQASLKTTTTATAGAGQETIDLGDIFDSFNTRVKVLGDVFGFDTEKITGLSGILKNIPALFSNITTKTAGSTTQLGDLSSAVSGGASQMAGLGSSGPAAMVALGLSIAGATSELIGLSDEAQAISGQFGILAGLAYDLFSGLFDDCVSEGGRAAETIRDFVRANIENGDSLAQAMEANARTLSAANDFMEFSTENIHYNFGIISQDWMHGGTALDIFTQSIVASGVSEEKAAAQTLTLLASFEDMGMSSSEAAVKMLEIAEASGMSTEEIDRLKDALEAVTGQLLDTGDEGADTTTIFDTTTDAAQNLTDNVDDLSGALDDVTRQMSGTGEETGDTGAIFNTASDSASALSGEVGGLSGALDDVTGQLSGTSDQGGDTTAMFNLANLSAADLASMIQGLSGSLDGVTGQLMGTGAETLATSGLFGIAGNAAYGLAGDIDGLSGMASDAENQMQDLQDALASLPPEKIIELLFNITTAGSIPALAAGGAVGAMGLAIVNERGPEIARFPGGSMAWLTSPGPAIGAFPVHTEIIPHGRAQQLLQDYPNMPRMAGGGTVKATAVSAGNTIININIHASVIDRNTIRMIEQELNKLGRLRISSI